MPAEHVYVQANSAVANEILAFARTAEGTLLPAGRFGTGGLGAGAIDVRGALALSGDGRYLLAANAGSDDVSVLALEGGGLRLVDRAASRAPSPGGLAVHGALVYVVSRSALTGYTLDPDGRMTALEGSRRPLPERPAQAAFTPDGRFLVVTQPTTDRIVTHRVGGDGRLERPRTMASAGDMPSGFAFDRSGRIIVTEAGAPGAGTVSSYAFTADGALAVISASIPTHQTAICRAVVTRDGAHVYTADTRSAAISGLRIDVEGGLALLDADGRTGSTGEGSRPADLALSGDGRHLYVLNCGTRTIGAFDVLPDGRLATKPYVGGIPVAAAGLVVA
jgi:6-phosphogluconolactonase